MTFSIFDASVPVFKRGVLALSSVLAKGAAFANERKIDEGVLLGTRLYPNMFPLSRQVQIAVDHAKGAPARLAGVEPPSTSDSEKTFADLQTLLKTIATSLDSYSPAQFVDAENRDILLLLGPKRDIRREFKGSDYLLGFAMPNFFFHLATAYGILRHIGVEVGKRDFLG